MTSDTYSLAMVTRVYLLDIVARMGDEAAEQRVRAAGVLFHEVPKIDDAVRNFLTVQLALNLQRAEPFEQQALMKMGRAVLVAVNRGALMSPGDWAETNPQRTDELGLEYIEKVAAYKAAHHVWTRVKTQTDTKVAKVLGKKYLETVWPQLVGPILDESSRTMDVELAKKLLYHFVPHLVPEYKPQPVEPEHPLEDDQGLIWSPNFQAELQRRSLARKEKDNSYEKPSIHEETTSP